MSNLRHPGPPVLAEHTGLECVDKGFAMKAADVFNPNANKRWAALGDRVIEWAVRRHLIYESAKADEDFVPCGRCAKQMKLLRFANGEATSECPRCPYCAKQQHTSNRALAKIAGPLAPVLERHGRDTAFSEHQLGTAMEAMVGLCARQFGLVEALKLYYTSVASSDTLSRAMPLLPLCYNM